MIEEWKDVVGYEGLYQVSNFGNIKSLFRYKRQLKPVVRNGYESVKLCKNKNAKFVSVHRVVAEAFIPNPQKLPIVNHKDENKQNNCVENLEWCTNVYNINYGNAQEKKAQKFFRSVRKFSLEGEFLKEYPSIKAAAKETGLPHSSISFCCSGRYHTAGGYKWKYKEVV